MIKNLLLGALLFGGVCACSQPERFTIKGTVGGKREGKVFIVGYGIGRDPDTLARSEVHNGKFILTGIAPDTLEALLYMKNEKVYAVFLLENAEYQAHLNLNDPAATTVNGTDMQNLFSEYQAIRQKVSNQNDAIRNRYIEASQIEDTAQMRVCMEELATLNFQTTKEQQQFRNTHRDGYIAAYLLYKDMYSYSDIEDLCQEYELLGTSAKNFKPARSVTERIREMEEFIPGKTFPNFTLPTPNGDTLAMYSIEGKVKLLDFWASWCAPCRAENPHIRKLYDKYHNKGFEILSISLDHQCEPWIKAIADDNLIWKHVIDTKNIAFGRFKLKSGIPHFILLDENNTIIANGLRGKKLDIKLKEIFGE